MKTCEGVEDNLIILGLRLNGSEWLASRLDRFTIRGEASGTHWKGDWVGSRAGRCAENKFSCPCRKSNSDSSAVHSVGRRYTVELIIFIYTNF
jgi:hypothetical protein